MKITNGKLVAAAVALRQIGSLPAPKGGGKVALACAQVRKALQPGLEAFVSAQEAVLKRVEALAGRKIADLTPTEHAEVQSTQKEIAAMEKDVVAVDLKPETIDAAVLLTFEGIQGNSIEALLDIGVLILPKE